MTGGRDRNQFVKEKSHSAAAGGKRPAKPAPAEPVLLATKLHPPASRPGLVRRPALVDQLDPTTLPKLTLVDAPPGWGKTTILGQWYARERKRRPLAWVSLDRGDNDPVRFWTYVVEGLRSEAPGIGAASLASLRVPGASLAEVVLPALINDLEALPKPAVLVLDDYHLITNPEVHEGLELLLEHLPATLHLVLATRADPPLPIARLRARGEILEIRAEGLRFTEEETAALLNEVFALGLHAEDIGRLHARTEGWAAGLHLAALSLRGRRNVRGFIADFAGDDRHIVDYLGAEVLDGQRDVVRSFLLQTSVLDQLSGPLCNAVLESRNGAEMLEEIERSNLFLVPLDRKREWFRYHHLFGELLRHELTRTEPELVPVLHRRASAWYRAEGWAHEAIQHATVAGDFDEAADLITAHWSAYLQRGRLETVAGWLEALPREVVEAQASLCLTRAWMAVNTGRLAELEYWIDAAERASLADPARDEDNSLRAAAIALRCIQRYMEGDVGRAVEAAREAIDLQPAETSPWRSVGCPVLGIALFWQGRTPDAVGTLEEAVERARLAGNNLAVIHAISCLATIHAERGELGEADRLARAAARLSEKQGLDEHWATTMAHVARAKVLQDQGELGEAQTEVTRAVEFSRRGVAHVEIAYALLSEAQVRDALGRKEEARQIMREAHRAIERCADPGILGNLVTRSERAVAAVRPSSRRLRGEPLSDRELSVLRLLPSKLSQREIGAALYVSRNTVKTHARGIYRKLGASTRPEAVARARELGLL